LKATTEREIDAAFESLVQARTGALLVGNDAFFNNRIEQLVALAAHHAIPAMYASPEFIVAGGGTLRGPHSQGREASRTAESWIGPGPNKEVSPPQLKQAIGHDVLTTLVQQTGLSQEDGELEGYLAYLHLCFGSEADIAGGRRVGSLPV
jgi:hypothetical protein